MIRVEFLIEKKLVTPSLTNQKHGNRVVEWPTGETLPEADAIFTKGPGPIFVKTADCLPVLLYDENKTLAAVHSGWRGTVLNVISNTLKTAFRNSRKIHAVIGPAIGPCCFQIRQDVIDAFARTDQNIFVYCTPQTDGTFLFDLLKFVTDTQLNLPNISVDLDHWRCTYCSHPTLPSYRRDGHTELILRSTLFATQP